MRKLLQQLQDHLGAFIEQRNDFVLVVRADTFDCAHVLKTLEAIDDGDSPDVFWMYGHTFQDPRSFVDELITQFVALHTGINERLTADDQDPWPPLPDTLTDRNRPPLNRLRETMIFSRKLLPDLVDRRAVWVLFPLEIEDRTGYEALIRLLAQHHMPIPWCRNLRLIVRDDKAQPILANLPAQQTGVQVIEPDLSLDAIEQSFEDEAADEAEPLPLRMQSLLVLAGMDVSKRRFQEALDKYKLLLRYYQATGDQTMTALTVNGMGEAYVGMGQDRTAKTHFESALTPAIASESVPVLLNVTLNLANLHLKHELWAEAASYYDSAEKLATAQLNAIMKIQCLENKGTCQFQQGQYKPALQSWTDGATLARNLEESDLLKNLLLRLEGLYQKAGMVRERRAVLQELSNLS